MQDLYTFDASAETAEETYRRVKTAYSDLLANLGLPYLVASADPGNVGGLIPEEFHVQADVGEDRILVCSKCSLKFNSELKVASSLCSLQSCPKVFNEAQGIEVAHCFLLGERYSKCFDATYQSPSGSKLMFMGCYGLGISRLLAVCIEHLTRVAFPDKSEDQITQLRWPVRIAPYSGSIVLQKSQRDGTYELIDVYKDRSCVATLEQARSAFSNPAVFDASSLPSWDHRQNERNINGNKLI
ncbi:unnamed protein product [Schistosoma haematobium]|nr:unnamed protein product [Schistosoma haematobium]